MFNFYLGKQNARVHETPRIDTRCCVNVRWKFLERWTYWRFFLFFNITLFAINATLIYYALRRKWDEPPELDEITIISIMTWRNPYTRYRQLRMKKKIMRLGKEIHKIFFALFGKFREFDKNLWQWNLGFENSKFLVLARG